MSGAAELRRRLFFAYWPNAAERDALADAFSAVIAIAAAAGGRPVQSAELHLTLEFLGPVPEAQLEPLAGVGAQLQLPNIVLALDQVEWWRRAAMLVVVPRSPQTELLDAQAGLRRALAAGGYRVDKRPFRPHVTLVRGVSARPRRDVVARVDWPLRELALVESAPTPAGSRYTPLACWQSGAAAADFGALQR